MEKIRGWTRRYIPENDGIYLELYITPTLDRQSVINRDTQPLGMRVRKGRDFELRSSMCSPNLIRSYFLRQCSFVPDSPFHISELCNISSNPLACHIPEDSILDSDRRENLKSYVTAPNFMQSILRKTYMIGVEE
jgi:hypothetical protein